MDSDRQELDSDFLEAAENWNLERLYIDLAAAKGRGLTPLEKKFLQALLCGYSPTEIADRVYNTPDSSTVRVYLSNGLYKYIRELFLRQKGEKIAIRNWSHITNLLERAGYKKKRHELNGNAKNGNSNSEALSKESPLENNQDWEEKIDLKVFVGRKKELVTLRSWMLEDTCRLVAIFGMGGFGKTTLGVKLVEQIQGEFEYVIWRSLRSQPPLEHLLGDLLQFFCPDEAIDLPDRPDAQLKLLMNQLRAHRCLLIFDRAEGVLQPGQRAGDYREDCADYGELFRRIGQEHHQSCCLLTSREQLKEVVLLEGDALAVRSLYLQGLATEELLKLPEIQELTGTSEQKQAFVESYANNPLAIKLALLTIKNFFGNNLAKFLEAGILVVNDLRELLDEHFKRLSEVEQRMLYALAVTQPKEALPEFLQSFTLGISSQEKLEALESLQRRMLAQKNSTALRHPQLFTSYLIEKLINRICDNVGDLRTADFMRQTLAQSLL
ncbi:NB-ARC domain-containing protein [Lusitaniella coriacea]|uniref:NB-ARC domain-containing protein n=1 Tax=Lusitaniella coriacea TaxID=1983105 RepID=UPI003CEBDB6F